MSNRKKSAKHGAGVNTKVMNAQTKQESAGETSQTTGCCSEMVKPLEERACLPLTENEADELQQLVEELYQEGFYREGLEDRAQLLCEASRALNVPEMAMLIERGVTEALSAKHDTGVKTKATNAETKEESAGETNEITCSRCGGEVEPLEERLYLPLTNRETWNLHHLVDEFHEEELEDRARFLCEVSRALNLPEIAVLIAGSMTKAFTKGGATAENPA